MSSKVGKTETISRRKLATDFDSRFGDRKSHCTGWSYSGSLKKLGLYLEYRLILKKKLNYTK